MLLTVRGRQWQPSVLFVFLSDFHLSSSAGQRPRDCVAFIARATPHKQWETERGKEGGRERRRRDTKHLICSMRGSIHPAELSRTTHAHTQHKCQLEPGTRQRQQKTFKCSALKLHNWFARMKRLNINTKEACWSSANLCISPAHWCTETVFNCTQCDRNAHSV